MTRRKRHTWNARQRLTAGPFYRTLSAGASTRKGLATRAGGWHLKVTKTLSIDIGERSYSWNHTGPGAAGGPVPAWRVVFPLALLVALTRWAAFASLRRFIIAAVVVTVGLVVMIP